MIKKYLLKTSDTRNEATFSGMRCYTTTTYVLEMPLESAVSEEEHEAYIAEFGDIIKLEGVKVLIDATVHPNIHAEDGKYVIFYRYGMADLEHRYSCKISYTDSLEAVEDIIKEEMPEILQSERVNWYLALADIAARILELRAKEDDEFYEDDEVIE